MRKLLAIVALAIGSLTASAAGAQQVLPRAGWVATASSSSSSDQPSKAIDGNSSTRFSTGSDQTAGQWFSLDMLTPQTFSQLTIDPAGSSNDFTRGYEVFVSSDAVTWLPVVSGTGSSGILTIVFPTQTARFVGIVQTSSASNWWSIAEINVYGPGAQPPSVALSPGGWVATASVTGGANVPSRAIDGALGTRWSTGAPQASGQSFQLDMLVARTITKVVMSSDGSPNDYARSFQVFATNDPSNFGTAIASGTGTSSLVTVNLPQTSARYVKIKLTGSASNWWSLAEVTVFAVGTFDPVPMALARAGWTASASSVCASDTPAKALDDNASTRWSSGLNQASGQFFLIDMQAPQSFTKITLDTSGSSGDFPRGYQVFISNDGANFGTAVATGAGSAPLVTINFSSQTARFIKIVQTGSASSWWSIHELNVYGIPPVMLLREGWVATASLSSSTAGNGIDGKLSTRWSTGTSQANGQWFQVDMLAPQSFNQITLNADGATNDFPRGYQVFASNSTSNWGPAIATGAGFAATISIAFPQQSARYLKIVQTGSASNWWSIAELNVLGPLACSAVCLAQDSCHDVGVCNPATGKCTNPLKSNGTVCSDANACTLGDTCQAGVCTPGSSVASCPFDDRKAVVDRVFQMDYVSDWTLTGGGVVDAVDQRTGGDAGLSLAGVHGNIRLISRVMPTLTDVSTDMALDIRLPASLAVDSPTSYGQLQLLVDSPSLGLSAVSLGVLDLTGLPLDAFSRLRFAVPANIAAKLQQGYSDLFFTIAMNIPSTSTGTFFLDELRFLSGAATLSEKTGRIEPGRRPNESIALDPVTGRVSVLPVVGGWGVPRQFDVPALRGTTAVCTADFNSDGSADILYSEPQNHRLSWISRLDIEDPSFLVNFSNSVDAEPPEGRPGPMACDDVDGDGDIDVVASFSGLSPNESTLSLITYANDGLGRFTPMYWNTGVPARAEAAGKSLADFNGDGKLDLAVFAADSSASSSAQVYIFTNTGTSQPFDSSHRTAITLPSGLMTSDGPSWGSLTSTDFNRDGKSDMWVMGNTGLVYAIAGKGNVTFDPAIPSGHLDVTRVFHEFGRRDIDGDQLPDLIVSIWPDQIPNLPQLDRILAARQRLRFPGLPWYPSKVTQILLRQPRQLEPGGGVLMPGPISTTTLSPAIQPTTTPIGLIKGRPVASSIVTGDGLHMPSLFVVSVTGHLIQRLQQFVTNVTVEVGPPIPADFPPGTIFVDAESCGGTCGPGRVCTASRTGAGGVCRAATKGNEFGTPKTTVETRWISVDHLSPEKTIIDGTPAVISEEVGSLIKRKVIVRALDGHLYWLDPDFDRNAQLLNNGWHDLGLPVPVAFEDGVPLQTSLASSNAELVRFDIQRSNERATRGVQPKYARSPTAVLGPNGALVFALDTLGRLQQIDVPGHRTFNRGGPVNDGVLGDGSPRAVSWLGVDKQRYVEVYVVDALHRPTYLQLTPGGDTAGGSWTWRQVPGVTQADMINFELRGTPDVVTFRARSLQQGFTNSMHRLIATQADGGVFMIDVAGVEGQASTFEGKQLIKSTISQQVGQGIFRTEDPAGDPRMVLNDTDTQVTVFVKGTQRRILSALAPRTLGPLAGVTTATFQWGALDKAPTTASGINGIVDFAAPLSFGFTQLFAVRADGTIVDGDMKGVTVTNDIVSQAVSWHDVHRAPGIPEVIASDQALRQGNGSCKDTGLVDETIFPQWVRGPDLPNETPRGDPANRPSVLTDSVLYANNNFTTGFKADKPRTLGGVVVRSHISGQDNPFDHDHEVLPFPSPPTGGPINRELVILDWNANIAPDIEYQHLMSEANLESNGLVEIEWEQRDDGWNIDVLPFAGDRLVVRGRHIFDCGHPPFKTEIHPPTSAVVIHENKATAFFSKKGGPAWYQPADPLLPANSKCSLMSQLEGVISTLDFWDKVSAANAFLGCARGYDLHILQPKDFCYTPYEHEMTDILNDNVPLEFDVPWPFTSFTDDANLIVSGISQDAITATSDVPGPQRFHVVLTPANMPAGPQFVFMQTKFPDGVFVPPQQDVEVCFQRNEFHNHDHHVPAEGVRNFLEDLNTLGGILPIPIKSPAQLIFQAGVQIACGKDDVSDEPSMFFSANGRWVQHAPWRQSPSQCVTVHGDVDIQSHGFECDMSCGEVFDDNLEETPDDREGTVDVIFSAGNPGLFGTPAAPKVYQVVSQPNLATTAQRYRTAGDYGLAFTLNKVMTGSSP